jgi:hypothetical protein
MDKIFASKPAKRIFLITVFTLLGGLLLLRLLVFPLSYFSENINGNCISFLEKFITSLFTAIIVGYFVYWIQGDEKKKHIDFTESGNEIEKKLNQGRLATNIWHFNGGLGRYTKSDTIPKLSEIAVSERKTITLRLIVLNPFNIDLLRKYISFRVSVEKESKKAKWTELEVQSEILATIVTALYYKKTNQFLDITIKAKDFFTLSRMDISGNLAVITREDPTIPSIIAEKDSYMYKHYAEEFQQVDRQSRCLSYEFPGTEVNKPTKAAILECIKQLFPTVTISDTLAESVHGKFLNPKSPFI